MSTLVQGGSQQQVSGPAEPIHSSGPWRATHNRVATGWLVLFIALLAMTTARAQTNPCTNPSVPTISATRTAICAGSSTILSVQSGSLNDATNWQWYSGSCGGTPAGTGPSIQVSPRSTTTYYVRGEGGCVTPGSCASQQITVNAPFFVNLTNNGPLTCVKKSVTLTTTGAPSGASYTYSLGAQASSASSATVTTSGGYSVTATVLGGCSATANTIVSSNTTAPSVSINPASQTICQDQTASFTAQGADAYRWSTNATTATILVNAAGPYSVTGTTNTNGCSATATASLSVNPSPSVFTVTGGGAYCAGSNGIAVGLSGSQTGANYQLRRDGANVGNPLAGTGNPISFGNQTAVGTYTVLATNPTTSCQQTMSGSATVSITPLPDAPSLLTASGYPYPAGQNNLTINQNVGPVSLTVVGCSGGMITANGNAASSFTVTTANTGTQTYTATCTQNGCTGPAGSFQLTVLPTTLSVLHRDADYGNTQNNVIKPYLELSNAGGQSIPYSEVTVRYWFTSEGQAPPTNLTVYYAQLGAVSMTYVPLSQPRQGAFGYVEYRFPDGGSLAGGGNSGPIENAIQKTDGSNFNENDDYSYAVNYGDYLPNMHITAYRNGTIFYGQEPTTVTSQAAVQVYSAAKDSPTTSQIQPRLELRNTGNVALPVSSLKLRYYFTSDNGQTASVYVDYADIGAQNVAARVVKLPAPVNGADSYVELSFPGSTMQVNALSSLGVIDFRLVRSDNGLFDQSNDYSYAPNYGNVGLNDHVTAYVNNQLVFGTPPSGAAARVAASEPVAALSVKVLGNPVVVSAAQVEIRGAEGQAVNLRLIDLQGKAIHEQRIEQAGEQESVSVPLGQSQGMLLLKVSTASQQQTLRLIRL